MNFLTELREGLAISFDAIRVHKLRSTLTTLGIVIGVVTVTLMGTVIEGLNSAFLNSISFLGAETLHVSRFSWSDDNDADYTRARRREPLTAELARAVAEEMKTARAVAATAETMVPVSYKDRKSDAVHAVGTTEQYTMTTGFVVAEGRFFNAGEAEGGRPVCVIGNRVATNLFVNEPAVGNRLRVRGQSFEVVGVLEKQGGLFGAMLDNQIFVPLPVFKTSFRRRPDVNIQVKATSIETMEATREELHGLLRRLRHLPPGAPDDFAINTQDFILKQWNKVAGTIAAVGLFLTGLSLFVGGIGIMNIMFVSVAERTKEIGIRKAIGAKRRTILIQFLAEAATICLLGGTIALALAWPLTLVLNRFMPATMSPLIVSIALLVSLLTGVVSGFLPAWRAARMNPVDALRSE